MATIHLEIVTIERKVYDDHVNMVVAPAVEGVIGILPRHAPVLTALSFGELQIKKDGQPDEFYAIGGGVLEVQPDHVIVLADSAEHADEIDLARAEAARKRVEELMAQSKQGELDFSQAQTALRRSMTRLRVGRERRKGGGGYGVQS